MNWKTHSEVNEKNQHAFLSPSKPHWVNYSEERLRTAYRNYSRAAMGTRLHAFAKECIELSVRLPVTQASLNSFVNDSIGYRMTPEQVLYYSENAFGTCDAISFNDGILRIHDLKTGVSPPRLGQLEIYASLFCLEYAVKPQNVDIRLRIYQNDELLKWYPDIEDITSIIQKVISHDLVIKEMKSEYDYPRPNN